MESAKQAKFHIHFVCTGNAYRSRLAEAYLKSKRIKNIRVSSSGVEAKKHKNGNGPATWYAIRLAQKYGLLPHFKPLWSQTDSNRLGRVNLIIFMNREHFEKSQILYGYDDVRHLIWNVPDLNETGIQFNFGDISDDLAAIEASETTFLDIKKQVDLLCRNLIATI